MRTRIYFIIGHGKRYTVGNHCASNHTWTDEKWEKVSSYHEKLTINCEKKERKGRYSSSFSGFSSPIVMSVPLLNITSDYLVTQLL